MGDPGSLLWERLDKDNSGGNPVVKALVTQRWGSDPEIPSRYLVGLLLCQDGKTDTGDLQSKARLTAPLSSGFD